jgi:hypothetical protein
MRVVLTVKELRERGMWAEVCHMRGWDEQETYALLKCCNTELTLSEQEAQRLGLIPVEVE